MQKYGRWEIVSEAGVVEVGVKRVIKRRAVLCRCECGTERVVIFNNLVSGISKSCGCMKLEAIHASNYMHGRNTSDATYRVWLAMRDRCRNPNSEKFKNYGGRGIKVCERWESFETFLADMGEKPTGKSIDRINVNGNYEPSNCRWATAYEQSRNRTDNRILVVHGEQINLTDCATKYGMNVSTLHGRLAKGMSPEEAIKSYGEAA